MLCRINTLLRRRRRRLVTIAAVLATALALLAAHTAVSGHLGHGMSDATIAVCLAVVETAAAVGLALAGVVRVARRRPPLRLAPTAPAVFRTPEPRPPRAGPQHLQVVLR